MRLDEKVVINKSRDNARHELLPLGDVLPIIEAGVGFSLTQRKAGMLK